MMCFCILVISVRWYQHFSDTCEGNTIQMINSPIKTELNPQVKESLEWPVITDCVHHVHSDIYNNPEIRTQC